MNHHYLLIARREFLEHVRTRGFWLSLLSAPAIMLLGFGILYINQSVRPALQFAVLDAGAQMLPALVQHADSRDLRRLLTETDPTPATDPAPLRAFKTYLHNLPADADRERAISGLLTAPESAQAQRFINWWRSLPPREMAALDARAWRGRFELVDMPTAAKAASALQSGRLHAYLTIPADPLGTSSMAPQPVEYYTRNLTDPALQRWISEMLDQVAGEHRRRQVSLDAQLYDWLRSGVQLRVQEVDEQGQVQQASLAQRVKQWAPAVLAYLLWISVVIITQMLMTSTIEEKSGKLMEVLLAATTPLNIMAGKILGIATTGLTIVFGWSILLTALVITLVFASGIAGQFQLWDVLSPLYLIWFLIYFLLGYIFYAALLCGLGSLCNTLKEAQTLTIPVMGLLFIPILVLVPVGQDPSGILARVLSWIPPFTPFVMMNRAAQPPDISVYLGTSLLMLVTTAVVLVISARLFQQGILMSGAPPGMRKLLRMLITPTRPRRAQPDQASER